MLHTFKCKQCGGPFDAYCFEHLNYTAAGWETRERQMDAMLCEKCFGETPEKKPLEERIAVPMFVPSTGDILATRGE